MLRSTDRRLLRELLLEQVQVVRGVAQERLCQVLDSFGFVDEWIEGLKSRRCWRRAECAENLGIASRVGVWTGEGLLTADLSLADLIEYLN